MAFSKILIIIPFRYLKDKLKRIRKSRPFTKIPITEVPSFDNIHYGISKTNGYCNLILTILLVLLYKGIYIATGRTSRKYMKKYSIIMLQRLPPARGVFQPRWGIRSNLKTLGVLNRIWSSLILVSYASNSTYKWSCSFTSNRCTSSERL